MVHVKYKKKWLRIIRNKTIKIKKKKGEREEGVRKREDHLHSIRK
jgi:hypothetical protein